MQLFNQLLLRRECCSFSNGEYVKTGLAEVELWIGRAKDWVGDSWEQLAHIRQVRVGVWCWWCGVGVGGLEGGAGAGCGSPTWEDRLLPCTPRMPHMEHRS